MLKALLLATIAVPATAQVAPVKPEMSLPNANSPDDVIVTALRIPRDKLPTSVFWNYQTGLPIRIAYENTQLFMRCALKTSDASLLRRVVDGVPNSSTARFAQGWLIETHRGCYPAVGAGASGWSAIPAGVIELGESAIPRGVIVESVLKTYAPDAELTHAITSDTTVQQRFVERENPRNRLRLAYDRDALSLASCLVQQQPVLATRLVHSEPGSQLAKGLTQTILIEGRQCLANARRVTIDPTVARTYLVDAFYRWVVAARGVDSLIPSGDSA